MSGLLEVLRDRTMEMTSEPGAVGSSAGRERRFQKGQGTEWSLHGVACIGGAS